jgi:type VI secretion system protein ImpL
LFVVFHLLFALLLGLTWALELVFQWPLALPAAITLGLAVIYGVILTVRWVRARRAARSLDAALRAQGDEQAKNARPDKRAQIAALQEQMREGLSALRASNVGGKRRGEMAMYTLPWYAIIGPPGAGKTTALRHSGLSFPHTDTALKGVGGTRNCDWWLTNEAILLDTAGRYATDAEDRREWLEFLDLLRKHRVNKPLNGLIIAVALPDVMGASPDELDAMGKKLRSRVDEVMTQLRMTLPVYFLVTKCDLVAGFVELFGDLRRSERAQPWGATIPLSADRSDPGALFHAELDLMLERIHGHAVKRLATERDRRARESIYQFPIELAAVKSQLGELVGRVFAPNAFQTTPLFRGFYFSSGTQEGLPQRRAVERMSKAMGIAPAHAQTQPRAESKSYFLHDVFTKVVFPDAHIAARSKAEVRRQRFVRLAIAGTAMALAITVAGPSVQSYRNNQALIEESRLVAARAAEIDWYGSEPMSSKLDALDPLLTRLKRLDAYERSGAPLSHRFLMYVGGEIREPLTRTYVTQLEKGFMKPVRLELERDLQAITGKRYHRERDLLKTYLMSSEVAHLDIEWATGRYTQLWADALKPTSDLVSSKLIKRLRPHVAYYLELLAREGDAPRAEPVPANDELVAEVREVLAAVPVKDRYQSLFVDSLEDAVYDPARGRTRDNLQFPPLTLEDLFADAPELSEVFRSKQHVRTGRHYAVPGPYTDKGHFVVLANLKEAPQLLEREAWVVPLTKEDEIRKIAAHLDRLAEDYETAYIRHWRELFADVEVASPTTLKEAIAIYDAIREHPESPQLRLLRALEDHTQWTRGIDEVFSNDKALSVVNRKINTAASRRLKGLRLDVDVRNIRGKLSRVPGAFENAIAFGVPESGHVTDTPLHRYLTEMDGMRARMANVLADDPSASRNAVALELKKVRERVGTLLEQRTPATRKLLGPMLHAPLSFSEP